MASRKARSSSALEELYAFGMSYPGAHPKSPWPGHRDLAVNDKTFAYLSVPGDPLSVSCKLPRSASEALQLPFTTPTEYGLGKSGWVSARFAEGDDVPVDLLKAWIDESYRAQAPKRLSASLPPFDPSGAAAVSPTGSRPAQPEPRKRRTAKRTAKKAAKKTAVKRPARVKKTR